MEEQKHKKEEQSCNSGIYMMKVMKANHEQPGHSTAPELFKLYIYIYEYVCTNTYN